MKKYILPFIFLFTSLLWSQMPNISCDTEMGIMNGYIYEYVYEYVDSTDISNTETHLLSKLEWDFKNLFYVAEKINIDFPFNLHMDFNVKAGIPAVYGEMQDYDWRDKTNFSTLTNYSIHDNKLNKYTLLSINTGWNINLPLKTTFTPLVAFSFESFSFVGIGGYYHYLKEVRPNSRIFLPPGNPNNWEDGEFNKGEKVIQYQQNNISCKFGFCLKNAGIPYISIALSGFITPYFALDCIDTHFRTVTMYWDDLQNGNMYEAQVQIGARLPKGCLTFCVGTQYIPKMYGPTSNKTTYGKTWYKTTDGYGGADRSIWSYSVIYSITL